MKLKEAVFTSLKELRALATCHDVYQYIISKNYYAFQGATPEFSVSATLTGYINNRDSRVKRIKQDDGIYYYYLRKYEVELEVRELKKKLKAIDATPQVTYLEKDLHILLSSFLNSEQIYSKTISHAQSNGSDRNQIWTHPDMVGVKFIDLNSGPCQSLRAAVQRNDTFKISSYELKKEILSDNDLKRYFFQALSNSSWANFGYLVALDINDDLIGELERLNQAFGIGFIQLNGNPFQSKYLFQAKYRDLDFITMDKISGYNSEFESFIAAVDSRNIDGYAWDKFFTTDAEAEDHCRLSHIPFESETQPEEISA